MVKLPALPNPDNALSLIDKAGSLIDQGLSIIDKFNSKLDKFEAPVVQKEATQTTQTTQTTIHNTGTAVETTSSSEEPRTLEYQLDLLLDDLSHLEEHLPAKGKLLGTACDCIAKASRSLRRHARETIPIAAREGKGTGPFDAIALEADYLMGIGTLEAVKSGKYDAEYLSHSGVISKFRKSVDKMLAEVKECPECEEIRRLSQLFSETRKAKT